MIVFAVCLFFIEMICRRFLKNYRVSLVIYVQRSFRRIHFNKSIVRLQSVLKSSCARHMFLQERNASIQIQRIVRGYNQRKEFKRKYGNIIAFKSFARKVHYSRYVVFARVLFSWCLFVSRFILRRCVLRCFQLFIKFLRCYGYRIVSIILYVEYLIGVICVVGVRNLRGPASSTRGPGWTYLWCTCCGVSCIAG